MPALSRRGLLALGAGGLLLPRRLFAESAREHKFLFVFCPGGWDVTAVFAPVFADNIDRLPDDEPAIVGGLPIVDSPMRPSVHDFFTNWGSRTCMINGMQVPSVAHDVCSRWTFTGTSRDGSDDWASIIAAHSGSDRILPNIHLSGPLYPHAYAAASVRVGLAGQLSGLSDGRALTRYDGSPPTFSPERDALEEAFVRARVDRWSALAPPGQPAHIAIAEQLALSRSERIEPISAQLDPDGIGLYDTVSVATKALISRLSRTGVVAYGAGGNGAWDTHAGNELQSNLFETLFSTLDQVLADLAAAPGEVQARMLDETTVVVLSEMGRTPQLNGAGGKDHWTWTSALLIGGGVAGGSTVGAWNEDLRGEPVEGETLLPGHLGATLLALADIDPAEFVAPTSGKVIMAALA